mgnify:CR=1 FL=1
MNKAIKSKFNSLSKKKCEHLTCSINDLETFIEDYFILMVWLSERRYSYFETIKYFFKRLKKILLELFKTILISYDTLYLNIQNLKICIFNKFFHNVL